MKAESIQHLEELLAAGATVTHRGFPVGLVVDPFEHELSYATRWEGPAGYHIVEDNLPDLDISMSEPSAAHVATTTLKVLLASMMPGGCDRRRILEEVDCFDEAEDMDEHGNVLDGDLYRVSINDHELGYWRQYITYGLDKMQIPNPRDHD